MTSGSTPVESRVEETETTADPSVPGRRWSRLAIGSVAGLVLLTSLLGAQHARWIFAERSDAVIDVDESAYLAQAIDVKNEFSARDADDVMAIYFDRDRQEAPLLSAITVPFFVIGTFGLQWGLMAQVAVLALLLVATFLLARRLVGDPWSLLAAAVVGCAPGFVDYTRSYQFALLGAATLTAAVYLLVASDRFTRPWASLGWGAFVGLTLLSRTVMVSFVPGLVLAAFLAAVATPAGRRRRLAWFGGGVGSAVLVAAPWWIANWHAVSRYLTGYGYGGSGTAFGPLYSPIEPMYYLRVPYRMAQELYVPLTALVLLGLALAAWPAVVAARREGTRPFLLRMLGTGHLLVVVTLTVGAVALLSSRNKGTGFVLPLLPMVVVLSVLGLSRLRLPVVRRLAVGALALVLLGGVVMKGGDGAPLSDTRSWDLVSAEGPLPVTDGRGRIEVYIGTTSYQPDVDIDSIAEDAAAWMIDHARSDGPVVSVAAGDPLFNANLFTVNKLMALDPIVFWIISATATNTPASYADELAASAGNSPTEFLVTMDLDPFPGRGPGAADTAALEEAARSLGFTTVHHLPLTEDRAARIWQRELPPEP